MHLFLLLFLWPTINSRCEATCTFCLPDNLKGPQREPVWFCRWRLWTLWTQLDISDLCVPCLAHTQDLCLWRVGYIHNTLKNFRFGTGPTVEILVNISLTCVCAVVGPDVYRPRTRQIDSELCHGQEEVKIRAKLSEVNIWPVPVLTWGYKYHMSLHIS